MPCLRGYFFPVLFCLLWHQTIAQNSSYNANTIPIGGTESAAFGYQALLSNGNYGNTGFGHKALRPTHPGFGNTAAGDKALVVNTTGSYNRGLGYIALQSNTTGEGNTATGYAALIYNTLELIIQRMEPLPFTPTLRETIILPMDHRHFN